MNRLKVCLASLMLTRVQYPALAIGRAGGGARRGANAAKRRPVEQWPRLVGLFPRPLARRCRSQIASALCWSNSPPRRIRRGTWRRRSSSVWDRWRCRRCGEPPIRWRIPELARRAAHCLRWLEGSASVSLPVAAARVLGQRKPAGAAAALLAYLPFADSPEVLQAVTAALAAVAVPNGKPDPALLRGLADPMAVRRAAAGVALCSRRAARSSARRPQTAQRSRPRRASANRAGAGRGQRRRGHPRPHRSPRRTAGRAAQAGRGVFAATGRRIGAGGDSSPGKTRSRARSAATPGRPGGATPMARLCWPPSASAP